MTADVGAFPLRAEGFTTAFLLSMRRLRFITTPIRMKAGAGSDLP
jgi:hypothetical protein